LTSVSALPPECTIFAGPNGAGKSTLYEMLSLPGTFINTDDVARALNPADPGAAALAAGRQVLHTLEETLAARHAGPSATKPR